MPIRFCRQYFIIIIIIFRPTGHTAPSKPSLRLLLFVRASSRRRLSLLGPSSSIKRSPSAPGDLLLVRRPYASRSLLNARKISEKKQIKFNRIDKQINRTNKMRAAVVLLLAALSAVANAAIIRTGGVELRKYHDRQL